MPKDLKPEPLDEAIKRGDRLLHFRASNGRENGPYDLEAFAIRRTLTGGPMGDESQTIAPIGLDVVGDQMTARFAGPLQPGDELVE